VSTNERNKQHTQSRKHGNLQHLSNNDDDDDDDYDVDDDDDDNSVG
jgi:hypothetical protein